MGDFVADDGVRLHYTVQGNSALPAICLHWLGGSTGNWISWGKQPGLHSQQLIALDFRGHGRSETRPCTLDNERLVRDVIQLADILGLRKFALIGHSYGGKLALQIASALPARVAALVLLGSVGPRTVPLQRADLEPLLQNSADAGFLRTALAPLIAQWTEPDLLAAIEQLRRTPAWALRAVVEAALWTDRSATVDSLSMPALIMAADRDPIYGPVYQESAVRPHLPRAARAVITNCGHGMHLEQPRETSELIGGFLKSVT